MEYLTVRETARKWNLSDRMVQQFCTAGRIPGAQKFGNSWAIPADAEKPRDPRSVRKQARPPAPSLLDSACLMPLMNTPFQPAGESGTGGGGLPHRPRYGRTAVSLSDLRLRQPLSPPDPARPLCA